MSYNFASYDEKLSRLVRLDTGVLIAFICFCVIITVLCLYYRLKWGALSVFVICTLVVCLMYFNLINPQRLDIENQSYVIYEGEFSVDEYYYSSRNRYIEIRIPGNDEILKYEVICTVPELERYKTQQGYFVISERTQLLLDIGFTE